MNRLDEILAVTLSVPALVLCVMVLFYWFPEGSRAVRERRDAADWLVIGVTTSFLGLVLSTSYWAFYWLEKLLDDPLHLQLLEWGAVVNLVTWQGAVIAAAYCHLKAYHLFNREGRQAHPNFHLIWTLSVAALLTSFLFIIVGGV